VPDPCQRTLSAEILATKTRMNNRKDDRPKAFKQLNLLSAGLMFPVSIVIGYGMGYYLDRWLGTSFLKIIFLLLGIAAGFVSFFRTISQLGQDE
jgi:ATP synthase protein I